MESNKLREVLEALLFSADVPLRAKTVAAVIGERVSVREINAAVKELNARYDAEEASFRIEEIAGGLQLLTRPEFDGWIKKLAKARQRARLTRAALETLAIVAYRQPLTRPAIEAIRGVDAGGVLGTLLERGLVRMAGRAETVGRPHLYATTPLFLSHFGLKSLGKLPRMDEITREMDRRGLVQDLARELGEDPEALDDTLDALLVAGAGAANGGPEGEPPELPDASPEPVARAPEGTGGAVATGADVAEAPAAVEQTASPVEQGAGALGPEAASERPEAEPSLREADQAREAGSELGESTGDDAGSDGGIPVDVATLGGEPAAGEPPRERVASDPARR